MSNPWNLQQNHHCGGDAGNSNSAGNNPSGNPSARNGWPVENGRGNIGYNTAGTRANCGAYYPSADRIGFSMQQVMQQQPIQNAMPFLSNNTGSFNGAYNAATFAPLNAVSSAGTYPGIGGPCFSAVQQQQQHMQQQHMQQQLRQGSQFAPFEPQPQPLNTPSFTLPAEPDMADSNLMNWAMRTVENSKHDHHEETDQVKAQQRGSTSVTKGVKEEPVKECQMARETSRRESFTFQASPIEGTFGSKKAKTQLPQDFKPGPHSVILGRGRCTESAGNKAFKIIVSGHLAEYVEAPGKLEKTQVSLSMQKKDLRQATTCSPSSKAIHLTSCFLPFIFPFCTDCHESHQHCQRDLPSRSFCQVRERKLV